MSNNNKNNIENKLDLMYIVDFLIELKQLISSGVTTDEAIDIIREDETNKEIKKKLDDILTSLHNGYMLGESLVTAGSFPEHMCNMITLAETTGKLENVLESLEIYYSRQIKLKKSLKEAIVTPLILLATMIFVVMILVTKVVPVFNATFNQLGMEYATMMTISKILSNIGIGLSILFIVAFIICMLLFSNKKNRNNILNSLYRKFGDSGLLRYLSVSKLTYSLSLYTSVGMSIEDALENFKTDNCIIAEKINHCKEFLSSGETLFNSFTNSNLYSMRESKILKIAEQSGNLHIALERLASTQEEECASSLNNLVNKLEPTIIFISCILAGTIMLSIMLPLLNIISTL